ncbi:hypothetical protein AB0B31_11245 [Catellatospora citrea]|uniref:hypothetical protein n=1 Tax=Catellatospora citrea TaxID=53366 RepID=UPI0033DBCC21
MYERVIAELELADTGSARRSVATTWAGILASADDPDSLQLLLGGTAAPDVDITSRCRTGRARRLIAGNAIAQLDRIMSLSVRDLRRIPNCGRATLVDILAATLLSLIDEPIIGAIPLPGLGIELERPNGPVSNVPAVSFEPVSDPLLDILKSR